MKKVAFCLVLLLGLFAFFACGSQPPPPPPPPPPPAELPSEYPPEPEKPAPVASTPRNTDLILDGAETYTVVEGDTLSDIAYKKYQNSLYFPLIMMASKDIVEDQDFILPGMVLTIPKLQVNLDDAKAKASMKKYFLETADITARKKPEYAEGLRQLANTW